MQVRQRLRESAPALAGTKPALVYFGPEPWAGMWRNRHQLMVRFARETTVVYVEPRMALKWLKRQILTGGEGLRQLRQFSSQAGGLRDASGVWLYKGFLGTPTSARPALGAWLDQRWAQVFRAWLGGIGVESFVAVFSRPEMWRLVGRLGEVASLYHVVDEYLAYSGVTPEREQQLRVAEAKMASSADTTIVVSDKLRKAKSTLSRSIHVVRNAVDFDAYSRALLAAACPPDLRDVPRPIVGYSGLISDRLDFELLHRIAESLPRASIVLLGSVRDAEKAAADRLAAKSNVFLLGVRPPEMVPAYVTQFQACIIPYRDTKETRSLCSLKLYDYLAAGRPVVSTPFPDANALSDIVAVEGVPERFVAALNRALEEPSTDEMVARRREYALGNTWEKRVAEIKAILGGLGVWPTDVDGN